jgi:uncharacterized protein YbbK (DUF523 family)
MGLINERIRLGLSACLLGEPVRFDGGHKRDPFLVESLGQFVEWVPVCPEVESGLDAPRESMRLVQADGRIHLLSNKTAQDHTTRMHGYARRRVEELADGELCGFVLKKDSPTCGLERVKVYGTAGMPVKSGRGLFADALVTRIPLLPVEEEGSGRLCRGPARSNRRHDRRVPGAHARVVCAAGSSHSADLD